MFAHPEGPDAPHSPPAVEARHLTRTYRRRGPALDDCSFRVPAGRVCALIGPNGAGKTTLLKLAGGMLAPSAGTVRVLGADPRDPGARAAGPRPRVAVLAQDKPLYPRLTVAETLRLGRELNPDAWDPAAAGRVVRGIPQDARVGSLSGGQRTRVALALCFGRRPHLMLLDEPLAELDALARHEVTGLLMAEVAERGTTILMSSHVLAELDGVCDHLLVLAEGGVRLAGDVDELIEAHAVFAGHTGELPPGVTVIDSRTAGRQTTALVRAEALAAPHEATDAGESSRPSLEELLLGYLRSPQAPPLLTPGATVPDEQHEQHERYAA